MHNTNSIQSKASERTILRLRSLFLAPSAGSTFRCSETPLIGRQLSNPARVTEFAFNLYFVYNHLGSTKTAILRGWMDSEGPGSRKTLHVAHKATCAQHTLSRALSGSCHQLPQKKETKQNSKKPSTTNPPNFHN